jgi:hypothetical protein
MKRSVLALVCFGTVAVASVAQADQKQVPGLLGGHPQTAGHYDAPMVTIEGHRNQPASIELSRVKPRLALSELKQPLLARVAQAVCADPF